MSWRLDLTLLVLIAAAAAGFVLIYPPATALGEGGSCPVGKFGHQLVRSAQGDCIDDTPLSAKMREVADAKTAAEKAYASYRSGKGTKAELDAAETRLSEVSGEKVATAGVAPLAASLSVTPFKQINSYYCGPATAMVLLWYLGPHQSVNVDPATGVRDWLFKTPAHDEPILANWYWLATDQYGGTNWGTAYMPFTLNTWRSSSWYVQVDSFNLDGSTAWLAIDYDMNHAHPVAENVVYRSSTYFPPGFSSGTEYQHWDTVKSDDSSFNVGIAQSWPAGTGVGTTYTKPWGVHWPAIQQWHGLVK
jgi:hypothetical protein